MIAIEQKAFDVFMEKFRKSDFGTQRLGQAFYNHFDLHKMADQESLNNIYAKDGKHAMNSIKAMVEFS